MERTETLNALAVARRIADRLDEDGIPKDVTDLEDLFSRRPTLDVTYIRGWLTKMVPAADPRLAILEDLERRFMVRSS